MDPQPFLFLDRDDTLIYDVPYLSDPEKIRFTPGAPEALRRLEAAGYRVAIVTNQSGIGRGYFTMEQLQAVHGRLLELLAAEKVVIDGIFLCPHAPQENCTCRKPATGMLEQACRELPVDRGRSVMIGDKSADIEMGRRFGLRTVQLVLPPKEPSPLSADLVVEKLPDAVEWLTRLLAEENTK